MQEIILGVMANILRTYAIYRFMEVMNPLKTVSRRLRILMYSGFIVLTSGGYYLFHNQIINIMTNLTGLMLILLIYKESLEKKIVFAIGIYSINVVIESLVFSATGLYKDYDEMTRSIKECITSLGIYFCVFLLERTCFKKERQFPIRTSLWIMMLSVPAFSIIEVFCMWQANYTNKRLISMEIIGILITNIAIFYLYDALQDYYEQKSEKEKFHSLMEGYRNQIEVMQESWRKIRSLRHDLKHHIFELKYLTAHEDINKILIYLDNMEKQIVNEDEYICSGISEVDSTLNYLLHYARQNLDDVRAKVALPEELDIHGFTLNVILGNLLDNAIYAAKQSEKKYLSIFIREKQGILYIQVENSYSGVLRMEKNKLLSTKENVDRHGIGLGNVEKIVKEKEGDININWDEEIFCVKVMLLVEKLKSAEII